MWFYLRRLDKVINSLSIIPRSIDWIGYILWRDYYVNSVWLRVWMLRLYICHKCSQYECGDKTSHYSLRLQFWVVCNTCEIDGLSKCVIFMGPSVSECTNICVIVCVFMVMTITTFHCVRYIYLSHSTVNVLQCVFLYRFMTEATLLCVCLWQSRPTVVRQHWSGRVINLTAKVK